MVGWLRRDTAACSGAPAALRWVESDPWGDPKWMGGQRVWSLESRAGAWARSVGTGLGDPLRTLVPVWRRHFGLSELEKDDSGILRRTVKKP